MKQVKTQGLPFTLAAHVTQYNYFGNHFPIACRELTYSYTSFTAVGNEATGYMEATVKKYKVLKACPQVIFFIPFTIPAQGIVLPMMNKFSHFNRSNEKKLLQACPEACLPGDSTSPLVGI